MDNNPYDPQIPPQEPAGQIYAPQPMQQPAQNQLPYQQQAPQQIQPNPYPTAPTPMPTAPMSPQPSDNLPSPYGPSSPVGMPTGPAPTPTHASGSQLFAPDTTSGAPAFAPASSAGKKRLPIFIAAVVATFVLLGAGAFAYYGMILPNKPEARLKTALRNSLEQKSVTSVLDLDVKEGENPSVKLKATVKSDTANNAASGEVTLTISGMSIPVEARFVDGNAYIKVGDLAPLVDLLSAASPETGQALGVVVKKVSNQWLEIDSTLIKDAGLNCQNDLKLTDADYKILDQLYEKHRFVDILSSSSETVNGTAATKFELSIDDNTGADFIGGMKDLPTVKKTQECLDKNKNKSVSGGIDQELSKEDPLKSLKDGDKTPLTVWVDNSAKRIVKIASKSTEKDKQAGVVGTMQASFDYQPVKIEKPQGAVPIATYLLQLNGLLSEDTPVLGDSIELLLPN